MSAHSVEWHKTLYDGLFAKSGLDSKAMHEKARLEATFVARVLKLKPNDKILDVPCGTGRHAKVLAELGYSVTGVDINKTCIQFAKKNCAGFDVLLKQGDMKSLSWAREKYDAVINMFTSFGYFPTDQENEAVLRQMIACLMPNGGIAIQTINRDFLMTIFDPARWSEDRTSFHLEASKYDPKTKYIESQKIIIEKRNNRAHRYHHRARLYSASEMRALMKKCGLSKVQVFGGPQAERFDRLKSTHPIYIGFKSER